MHPLEDFYISFLLTVLLKREDGNKGLKFLLLQWAKSFSLWFWDAAEIIPKQKAEELPRQLFRPFFIFPTQYNLSACQLFQTTFNGAWDKSQLNPTCAHMISVIKTSASAMPQPQVNNNDILLVVEFKIFKVFYWSLCFKLYQFQGQIAGGHCTICPETNMSMQHPLNY